MPGAPILSRIREGVEAADVPPFPSQCIACFPSRFTVTAHTDVPDHFLRVYRRVAHPFAQFAKGWEFQTPIAWDSELESPHRPAIFSRRRFSASALQ